MDWQGQKLAEQIMQYTVLFSAVLSFLVGYLLQSYKLMMGIYSAGILVASLVTVPDWPFFNRHPLPWLSPDAVEASPREGALLKSDKSTTPAVAPFSKAQAVKREKEKSGGKAKR